MNDASGHDPDLALALSLSLARAALGSSPAGILTDLDGTLAPIASDPRLARPLVESVAALSALASKLAVIGVVTGRAAHDARDLLGTDQLLVIGNHGLEWLEPGESEARTPPALEWVSAALATIAERAQAEAGVWAEEKGLSTTLHFRNAADPPAARRRLLEELGDVSGEGLVMREGRMSLELRPAGAGDKGTAVDRVVARHALRGLLVLGDDVTDLDMFRAATDARAAGRLAAAIVAVGGGGEVPPSVAAAADAVLPDPSVAAGLLSALAADLAADPAS